MKSLVLALLFTGQVMAPNNEAQNKQLALGFYQDLWFTNNTDKYEQYMAKEYVAHDTGDRKGVTEAGIEQKIIADRFWQNGDLSGSIDYQIADGDMVATRWHLTYRANSLLGKVFEAEKLPIINVFRIENGKIVELWNHRHDIDTGKTFKFSIKGFMFGLLIALVPTFLWLRARRKLKNL